MLNDPPCHLQVACAASVHSHVRSTTEDVPAKLIPAAADVPIKGIFLTLVFDFLCLNLHIKDPSTEDIENLARYIPAIPWLLPDCSGCNSSRYTHSVLICHDHVTLCSYSQADA